MSARGGDDLALDRRERPGDRGARGVAVTAPGQVRLSFRSKGSVDVAALAARWGGGGHRNAAGATVSGQLAAVERSVIAAAARHLAAAGRPAGARGGKSTTGGASGAGRTP